MPLSSLALVTASVILLVGLTQRFYQLAQSPRDPVRRAICACLAGLLVGTAAQVATPPIDAATGVVQLGNVLSDGGAIVAACAGRVFFVHVNLPFAEARMRVRRCLLGLLAALAAVAVLFVLFPPRPSQQSPVYTCVYIWYVSITFVAIYRLARRYARLTDQPFLRLGLRVIVVATVCGLGFLAVRAAMFVQELTGGQVGEDLTAAGEALEVATEASLLVGVLVPRWGTTVAELRRRWGDYLAYRRLRPLWRALYEAAPEFVLLPPGAVRRPWLHRDLGFLLYRQVIEIRDGQLALRPYADPEAAARAGERARAAGLPADEVRAVTDAAALATGIAAKKAGLPPKALPGHKPAPGGDSLFAEIAWLEKVSRAYARWSAG